MMLFCLVLFLLVVGEVAGNSREKRLTSVVCDTGTTKITSPHYYIPNAPEYCQIAVGLLDNDITNIAYRQECQRWMGGALPSKVEAAQLIYCYEYPNGTIQYDMGICCPGTPSTLRCFTGDVSLPWSSSERYQSGHISYVMDFENSLSSCAADEVCQTRYVFHGVDGVIHYFNMSKGCAKRTDCEAIRAAGNCVPCKVATPECASCCDSAFCNFDYTFYNNLRPKNCPPCEFGPCANGAECWNQPKGGYDFTCKCRIQWKGPTCNESRSLCAFANPCLNNGTCYDYSDMAPGDYRCDCHEPFVGDNCEIRSNLTCRPPDVEYTATGEHLRFGNCTPLTWSSFGHPDTYPFYNPNLGYNWNNEYLTKDWSSWMCGVEGHDAAFRIFFEVLSCRRGDYFSWLTYNSCCRNRTTCSTINPCLNGGTCYDWSDIGVGEYRCDCAPGFTGDNCEITNMLPCDFSDPMYLATRMHGWYHPDPIWNCTTRSQAYQGQPYHDVINNVCRTTKPSLVDGHWFMQGVDGQIKVKPNNLRFEVNYCGRDEKYSWNEYHMCCPSCLSSPCQNGGYCVQTSYNEYICRCPFGYFGVNCELRTRFCVVTGDPHYRTFDSKKYHYHGVKKYILARPCVPDPSICYFEVLAQNEYRMGQTAVSYVNLVEIRYSGSLVVFVTVPSRLGWTTYMMIFGNPSLFVIVPSIDYIYILVPRCGFIVRYKSDWFVPDVVVIVTEAYNGKMCGLCGNADDVQTNDFTLPNGTYVGDLPNAADLFGNSYIAAYNSQPVLIRKKRAAPSQTTTAAPMAAPCIPSAEHVSQCGIITNPDGMFGRCIPILKPQVADAYFEDCTMDACYSDGQSICKSIQMFVFECMAAGFTVPCTTWLQETGCTSSDLCPSGMDYSCLAKSCPATCANPTAPDECVLPNADQCVCPTGQFLFNGTCVETCPPFCVSPTLMEIMPGESVSGPECTTMTCIECENCTEGAELQTTQGCPPGEQCVSGWCFPIQTPATDLPPGLQGNTHAQDCAPHCGQGGNNGNNGNSGTGNNGNGGNGPPSTPPGHVDNTHVADCVLSGTCGNNGNTKAPPAKTPVKSNQGKKKANGKGNGRKRRVRKGKKN